jgi:hypothetical protein
LSTGRLSPVSIDSSTLVLPARISPSTGTRFCRARRRRRRGGDFVDRQIRQPAVAQTERCRAAAASSRIASRFALGARFQPLAEQHQRDDDGGRLEVQMGFVPGLPQATLEPEVER